MPSYTINEPHPTVPQNSYIHSGRGGAGNTFRVSTATTPSVGVPTKAATSAASVAPSSSSSSAGRFYSGRGGAGNAHTAAERVAMSFDDEYAEAARHASASTGHVGRGGAGNIFSTTSAMPGAAAPSNRRDSSSTNGSERSGFWGRLSGSHKR